MGYGVPDSGVDFIYISVRDAYLLMKSGKAVFVDARDKEDYDKTRLQTAFHLSANDLFFQKHKIDNDLVQHLIELAKGGKTIVALSDACVMGNKNRGHVSRCRHIAQYLVEISGDDSIKGRIVRMMGGINEWKSMGLDGVIGDQRRLYAGAFLEEGAKAPASPDADDDTELLTGARAEAGALFAAGRVNEGHEKRREAARAVENATAAPAIADSTATSAAPEATPEPLPADAVIGDGCTVQIKGLKARPELNGQQGTVMCKDEAAGRFEVLLKASTSDERVRVKPDNLDLIALPKPATPSTQESKPPAAAPEPVRMITVCLGGNVMEGEEHKEFIEVPLACPRPPNGEKATAYRTIRGEIYKKPSKESDKIIKIDRPVSSIVRTTGEVWVGNNGGNWAELDTTAGEKKGWVYIEGPGFGPSTRKIRTEYLRF